MEASLRVCGEKARNKQDSYNLVSKNGIRAHTLPPIQKQHKLQGEYCLILYLIDSNLNT